MLKHQSKKQGQNPGVRTEVLGTPVLYVKHDLNGKIVSRFSNPKSEFRFSSFSSLLRSIFLVLESIPLDCDT